jgi:CO/xanthine dehydrogenase Mo-binding subunit
MPADNKHAAAKNKLEGRSARPNGSLSKNLRRLPRAFNAYARASVRRKEDFRFLTGTACYVVERLVDRAAREMKLDPAALRRRNFVPNDAYPYTTPVALTYDSGDYFKTLDMAVKAADYAGFEQRRQEAAKRGKLRGMEWRQMRVARFGTANEHGDWETAHHVFS